MLLPKICEKQDKMSSEYLEAYFLVDLFAPMLGNPIQTVGRRLT